MSSWKLTKKLKETHFLRGHSSSSNASLANEGPGASSKTPQSSFSQASSQPLDTSRGSGTTSTSHPYQNSRPESSKKDGMGLGSDPTSAGSRANTITESSRSTITASNPAPSANTAAGEARSAPRMTSSQNAVARNAAGLLRVKIYELRHLVVDQYRHLLPQWAFEKSSTKPPPVYIVLEYDKTQILLHAIGGTVEDPVWDKTTAFDVVSGNVPLNMSVYLRTRLPYEKKTSSESERRSSTSEEKNAAAHYHHSLASESTSDSDMQPSSVASDATTMSTSSSGNSKKNGDPGLGSTANAVKEAEELRIRDVLLDTTRVEPSGFTRQDQLAVAGGVLNVKCELHNTRNHSLSMDDFTLMKVIGKGSFGKVMQVRKNDTRQVYALKTIRKAHIVSKSEVGHTLAERTVLAKINNPFIVPLKFSFQSPEKLYLVLAFVNGGELFHHLQREGRFDLNRARFYTAELLCALECLHEYNVIYRDLKPENILLDYTGHIALCDFGLCKLNMGSKDHTSTFCGTPEYLAPELLLGQGYTKAVDWWTLGVLFYEMLTGLPPFYDQNTNTMYHKIVKDPLTFPADMDREAKSLISLLLDRDPTRRLGSHGAAEIKAHPFFHQIDWKYLLNKKYAAPFLPSVASAVDTSNFDSEFTSEVPMDSVVDKQFYLSDSVQQQFGGWSYANESRLASSGKW